MDETLIRELSGALIEKLNVTTLELLSALNSLSGVPIHPYERLKYDYFGDVNYKFKTIDDIEYPENFCINTCISSLTSITQKQQEQFNTKLQYLDQIHDIPNVEHAFTTLSSTDTKDYFIVDTEQTKNFIEFNEILRTIPIESITPENSLVLAHKILSHYTRIF